MIKGCEKRLSDKSLFIVAMALLMVIFFVVIISFLVSSGYTTKECVWNSSQDFQFGHSNESYYYRLNVRSYSQDYIYNSTYFRIERLVKDRQVDEIIIDLREAEAFVKFMKLPSEPLSIYEGLLREFQIRSLTISDHKVVQITFVYPYSTTTKYIHFEESNEIAKTLKPVISEIIRCAFEIQI